MRRHSSIQIIGCACALMGMVCASRAQETMVRLRGNIPPIVAQAAQLDRLDANSLIRFSIMLPSRNQAEMGALLQRMYTPGDSLYHHYLTNGEYARRFGPVQADYDAVIAYARQEGFEVVHMHANRTLVELTGTADQVEKAFGVRMMRYAADNGRIFHAPDGEPAVPASIAGKISGIIGLDDALEPKSNRVLPPSAVPGGNGGVGTGPNQGLAPSDIKTAYNLNVLTETGIGQTIALFELDGYLASDVRAYETNFHLPNVTLQNVLLNGVSGNPSPETNNAPPLEVTLDVELAMAICTNVTKILVYEGNNYVTIYTQIADDNAAQQVSTSWYAGRDVDVSSSITNGEYSAFTTMAMQGQTLYAASGDYGDKVRTGTDSSGNAILKFGVQDPSAQPFVTGVGGTTLASASPGGPYTEAAWPGSGGGISGFWGLPNYQSSVVSPGSGGSSNFRNVPDVSLCSGGNSYYAIYYSGAWTTVAGTSCAAPLWAGFTTLVNQRRVGNGAGRLGFLNPTLYYLGNGLNYAHDFNDITSGNNGTYPAVSLYDNCTGWGSFNGGNVISDLQVDASVLYVDGGYTGATQNGAITTPYKTVTAAVTAASSFSPTLIYIKGNAYLENPVISKNVLLVNNGGGSVVIGH